MRVIGGQLGSPVLYRVNRSGPGQRVLKRWKLGFSPRIRSLIHYSRLFAGALRRWLFFVGYPTENLNSVAFHVFLDF